MLPENPGVKNHANEEKVKKGEKNIKKESPTDHKMELLIDLCITSCVSWTTWSITHTVNTNAHWEVGSKIFSTLSSEWNIYICIYIILYKI